MSSTTIFQSILRAFFGGMLITACVAFASVAYAQDAATSGTSSAEPSISVTSEPVEVLVDPNTGKIIGNREVPPRPANASGKIMEKRDEMKNTMTEKKGALQDKRAEAKDAFKDKRDQMKDKMASTSERLKEKYKEKRSELTERAKERAKAFLGRAIEHLAKAHDRLAKLITRIEERIAKLKDGGAVMTGADTALATAKSKLGEADAAISMLEGTLATPNTDTTEEGVRAHLASIKEAASDTKKSLLDAHEAIRALLKAVKDSARTLPKTATSTLES